jgi:hypothetical protein
MEYKFLDSKLPVDLTNLIASFVGPKNKAHVKEINSMQKEVLDNVWYYKYNQYVNDGVDDVLAEINHYLDNDNYLIDDFRKLKLKPYSPPGFWDDLDEPNNYYPNRYSTDYDSDSDSD